MRDYQENDQFVDISKVFLDLLKHKIVILTLLILGTSFGIFYSLKQPNIYKSEAILSSGQNTAMNNSSISNFAQLAGIDLSLGQDLASQNLVIAKELLHSRSFFKAFVDGGDDLPLILAANGYNSDTANISFSSSMYNASDKTWLDPYKNNPLLIDEESFEKFWKDYASLSQKQEEGIYILTTRFYSPIIAKEWNDRLIRLLNGLLWKEEKKNLNLQIEFLKQELLSQTNLEIKKLLSDLISSNLQRLSLLESKRDFIFEIIDPPIIAIKKDGPRRSFIVLVFFFTSLVISFVYALARENLNILNDKTLQNT